MNKLLYLVKQATNKSRRAFYRTSKLYCPYGQDFGLCIIPQYIRQDQLKWMQDAYAQVKTNCANEIIIKDGCLRLPPLHKNYVIPLIDRLQKQQVVPAGWFNHQENNMYEEGDFLRAHIDNLFVYDDIIVTFSIGSNVLLRLVHVQSGEKLDVLIPHGSIYILSGPARYVYFHMILPVQAPRYSLVLRRSIFNSLDGGLSINQYTNEANKIVTTRQLLPYEANEALRALQLKAVGVVRIPISDDYLQMPLDCKHLNYNISEKKAKDANSQSYFHSAQWVQRLRPLNDWSLSKQLQQDEQRVKALQYAEILQYDFSWRFRQLQKNFALLESTLTDSQTEGNASH